MGEQRVSLLQSNEQMQQFVRHLLNDVEALQYMLKHDWFEKGIVRMGAEQEMCLINRQTFKPAPVAVEALEMMEDFPWVETELARFNLEINLDPRTFTGKCLSEVEAETRGKLSKIQERLKPLDANILLAGILPTIRKSDMLNHNLTPKKRYISLIEAIDQNHVGKHYELHFSGIDELNLKHSTPFIEACNTSYQVHLQVHPDEFVKYYNISQVLAGPVMAMGAFSPIVFGRRLWHESRIAMFQQALDTRSTHEHMRERSARVSFGNDWLRGSILNIYKEDIARFRVLLSADVVEESLELIEEGITPKLMALQVHNSTVYRWNRPCYGISPNGKPHLRIENRVFSAGPTVQDEVANAAFWLGAMKGMAARYEDITTEISFANAKDNFMNAARSGIDAGFTWLGERKTNACNLAKEELIGIAEEGLQSQGVDQADIDYYLGIIRERAKSHKNGARWALSAYTSLRESTSEDEALAVLTSAIVRNQHKDQPVHLWPMPELDDLEEYRPSNMPVDEFMTTDLFTVQKDDILELVAELMDWRKIRYTPVEDRKGNLVGLVTSRTLLRHFTTSLRHGESDTDKMTVKEIMIKNPITVTPRTTLIEALQTMRSHQIGCLPVVIGKELVGIITEMDFLRISSRLIERLDTQRERHSSDD